MILNPSASGISALFREVVADASLLSLSENMKKLEAITERLKGRQWHEPVAFEDSDYLLSVAELARVAMSTGQTIVERASAHQKLYDLLEEEA